MQLIFAVRLQLAWSLCGALGDSFGSLRDSMLGQPTWEDGPLVVVDELAGLLKDIKHFVLPK